MRGRRNVTVTSTGPGVRKNEPEAKGRSVSTYGKRGRLRDPVANNTANNAALIPARQRNQRIMAFAAVWPVAGSLGLVGMATIGLVIVSSLVPLNFIPLLYMPAVVLVAIRWGIVPGLVASVASALAADFFFYPPLYSFWLDNRQDLIDLLLYLLVAIVTSNLAARLKQEADTSRARARQISDLHALSQRLATCLTSRDLIFAVQECLSNTLGYRAVLIGAKPDQHGSPADSASVPAEIRRAAEKLLAADADRATTVREPLTHKVWLVRTIVPEILGYGAIAIELGTSTSRDENDVARNVDAVLQEAATTLNHLKMKEALEQATISYRTEVLRDALIGGMSHEMRTPLASILGSCSVLNAKSAIVNDSHAQALVEAIHDQATQLDNQIRNVLDAARISAKGVQPQRCWTDPTDIVDAAVRQKARRLSGHRLVFDLRPDLPLIHVDSVLIQQALAQVLENAAKYSSMGSTIKVSSAGQPDYVELSVTDHGSGLTADEISVLGKRGYRNERSAAGAAGSGLGLWIASTFVAANGGSLFAESGGLGRGSTISLRLPTIAEDTPVLMEATDD